MCRFLLIKSKNPVRPIELFQQFSEMCQQSKTREGDWQGDGWGIAYLMNNEEGIKNKNNWKVCKSLKPIWENTEELKKIPESTHFAVHARSASFANQKGNIDYNEPFIDDETCFVFNGIIKRVRFPNPVPGDIGAQKIYSLVKTELKNNENPSEVLQKIRQLISTHAKTVEGMNIGLIVGESLYALCDYEENEEYFGLHYTTIPDLSIISSAPIGHYTWRQLPKGDIISL